ncbi:MAG: glycosyltransferase [Pseudobdellovibrionaceae bacterium]
MICALGTQGDLNPMIGLALELKSRGHHVCMAAPNTYEDKLRYLKIDWVDIKPSRADIEKHPDWASIIVDPKKGVKNMLKQFVMPFVRHNYQTLLSQVNDFDVFINHSASYAVPPLMEKFNKKWASIVLYPSLFFSSYDPPIVAQFPNINKLWQILPQPAVRFLIDLMKKRVFKWASPILDLRKELQLSLDKNPIFEGQFSPYLNISLFSNVFARRQPDWPVKNHSVGFPLHDKESLQEHLPDTPAVSFLKKSLNPKLIFTLGSMAVHDAADFFKIAVQVRKKIDATVLLIVGRGTNNVDALADMANDENILIADYEIYSAVFPLASVVIHQGGIGTVSQAMAAGVPQLIVPFMSDQFDNAYRIEKMHLGLRVLKSDMTLEYMCLALEQILQDPRYLQKAKSVQNQISKETGLKTAADLLEHLAQS